MRNPTSQPADQFPPTSEPDSAAVLLVAAGAGRRFGGALPKQFQPLLGQPVLRHSLAAFAAQPRIGPIFLVVHADYFDVAREAAQGFEVRLVQGGDSRQESVRRGLEAMSQENYDTVLIHDGVRPLVSGRLIADVQALSGTGVAALPALRVVDTLKRIDRGGCRTENREDLFRAQTPQGFPFAAILAAHRRFADHAVTDDIALAELAGLTVGMVDGEEDNLKITTPEDLHRAERILLSRLGDVRTGTGFDVHRFDASRDLWLGGVKLPEKPGLAGHSDADVALHAITDAVLGCLADGDIGVHFSPQDPRWRGAASSQFLHDACARVRQRGGVIAHIDLTLIGERPRIGPHRQAIRESIAGIAGLPVDRISVKATTTERLGFTGREEGMAAQATVTVRLPA
ncbi:MAG: bifunctional 2-C-methyl-D-erythritol 4-phosphate cytidylyltransferase/2-C-methyl-D-erythritol 2,4-cyclodiphosphate synthase [Azospirillaceae bacterium]